MGNLIWILLEIYCSLQRWNNFANRSRIDIVIAMVRVAPFFDSRCRQKMTELWQWTCGGVVCVWCCCCRVVRDECCDRRCHDNQWPLTRCQSSTRSCHSFHLGLLLFVHVVILDYHRASDLTSYVVSGILYELGPSYGSEKRSGTLCYLLQWQMAPRFYATPYISCYVHVSLGLVPSWRTVSK